MELETKTWTAMMDIGHKNVRVNHDFPAQMSADSVKTAMEGIYGGEVFGNVHLVAIHNPVWGTNDNGDASLNRGGGYSNLGSGGSDKLVLGAFIALIWFVVTTSQFTLPILGVVFGTFVGKQCGNGWRIVLLFALLFGSAGYVSGQQIQNYLNGNNTKIEQIQSN